MVVDFFLKDRSKVKLGYTICKRCSRSFKASGVTWRVARYSEVRSSVIRFKSGWKIELLTFHPSLHEQFLNFYFIPSSKYWMKLWSFQIVQNSLRRLYFILRDYEFEKSENDSGFAKRSPWICSSCNRVIFFITLFVMNYKVVGNN